MRFICIVVAVCLAIISVAAVLTASGKDGELDEGDPEFITLATTTSTENSGLLAYLHPHFERNAGIRIKVLTKGTGAALQIARNGDADVVMVHSPVAEEAFVKEGYGIRRHRFMHNDFVLVGPAGDPANSKNQDILEALKRIASSKSLFVSRGDHSGTHDKENFLWREAGLTPETQWLLSIGQGMGKALILTDEKQAYTLADRGTYLSMKKNIDLVIISQGSSLLQNPYSVIPVSPKKHPHTKFHSAMLYINWLCSAECQALINSFKIEGESLFYADLIPSDR